MHPPEVGETLRSQADRRTAFLSIQNVLPDHKIRRIHRRRIKHQLWADSEYLKSGYVDDHIDQLNSYYDTHGHFPETYFEIQTCPEYSCGVLPYSADDGPTAGNAVKYNYNADTSTLTVGLKTSNTLTPASHRSITKKSGGADTSAVITSGVTSKVIGITSAL